MGTEGSVSGMRRTLAPSRRRRRVSSSSAETSQQSAPDPTLLDDLEQDLGTKVDVPSDEVLLMRPKCGRHVVPRIFDASLGCYAGGHTTSLCNRDFAFCGETSPPHPTSQAGHRPDVYTME